MRCRPILPMGLVTLLAACSAQPPRPAAATGTNISPQPASAPAPRPATVAQPLFVQAGPPRTGVASWYAPMRGLHRTYTGEHFTGQELSAASPFLPMGTMVRVAVLNTGDSIVVRINDRMPHGHRLIDLSERAARQLGLLQSGVARVSVTPVRLADAD